MSGIGFSELIILFLIGLIVLGPERLPRVANQLGRWIGQARRMTRVLKRQLEDELDLDQDLRIQPPPAYTPRDDDVYSPVHAAESPSQASGESETGTAKTDERGAGKPSADETSA